MPNFKERKDKNVKRCIWKKTTDQYLKVGRMKTKDKMCNLEKK